MFGVNHFDRGHLRFICTACGKPTEFDSDHCIGQKMYKSGWTHAATYQNLLAFYCPECSDKFRKELEDELR